MREMLTGWRLRLAPLWVPLIPAIGIGLVCFVTLRLTTEAAIKSSSIHMSPVWQNAQKEVVSSIPDPLFAAIGSYLICVPFVYFIVGKILQEKARKEKESKFSVCCENSNLDGKE